MDGRRDRDNQQLATQIAVVVIPGLALYLLRRFFDAWEDCALMAAVGGFVASWCSIAVLARLGPRWPWLSWIVPVAASSRAPTGAVPPQQPAVELLARADALLAHPSSSSDYAPHWNKARSLAHDISIQVPELKASATAAIGALGDYAIHPTAANRHVRALRDGLAAVVAGATPENPVVTGVRKELERHAEKFVALRLDPDPWSKVRPAVVETIRFLELALGPMAAADYVAATKPRRTNNYPLHEHPCNDEELPGYCLAAAGWLAEKALAVRTEDLK